MVLDSGRLVEDKGILMENPFRLQRSGLPIEDIVELLPVFVQQRGVPSLSRLMRCLAEARRVQFWKLSIVR